MPNTVRVGTQVTGVGKSSSELDKLRDKFEKVQKQGAKGFGIGLGVGVATAGIGLVTAAVGGLTEGVGQAIDASSRLHEAMSLTGQVFKENTDEVETWAEGAARSFGQSKSEALSFAAGFGTAFTNVGQSLEDTTKHAEELTHLAADLGSAFDRSSEEAATALRSGLLGESEPLRAFGVFLDEAKVKAKAAALGMEPLNGALTDGQKVAARYAIIMEQTAASQGMFGRDVTSAADAQKRASAVLENSLAKIGDIALPAVTSAAGLAADSLENLATVMDVVGGKAPVTEQGLHDTADAISLLNPAAFIAQMAMGQLEGKAAQMAEEATRSSRYMADAMKDDFVQIDRGTVPMTYALERIGVTAEDAAKAADQAMKDIVGSVKGAASDLEAAGQEAADAIYDPIIEKAELARLDREASETRAKLKSKEIHGEERAELEEHLAEVQKDQVDHLVKLAAAGDREAAARVRAFVASAKASGKLSLQQIADLDKLLRKLGAVEGKIRSLSSLTFQSNHSKDDSYNGGRAAHGPVSPGGTYIVGENGPEKLVMGSGSGHVTGTGGGGWGGGVTVNVAFASLALPSPAQQQQLASMLTPILAKEMRRSGLLG